MSRALDSPAYDASEEDNDPLTDDSASVTDVHVHSTRAPRHTASRPSRARHPFVALLDHSDGGTDSPTYDGDIESSTTAGPDSRSGHYPPSAASTLPSPESPATALQDHAPPFSLASAAAAAAAPPHEPAPAPVSIHAFDPAKLSPADIHHFVRAAIAREGPEGAARAYTINPPPLHRPVRIYADGVYDLFHFGHALQLRQAKLSFPSTSVASSSALETPAPLAEAGVYLLVGVNSDDQCVEHKNLAVMSHAERCEAVRHCRWVDEVVPDAPWVIDESFIQKHSIDYVAHDEDPYAGVGTDDVYGYVKRQGKFLPTRRTPGVSTSELLERIVQRYRARGFDAKLARMGHAELMAAGSDYDGSAPASARESRAPSVMR